MSKKTFNPTDWQPSKSSKIETQKSHNSDVLSPSPSGEGLGLRSDLELIVQRIEFSTLDIAPNYADWRDLGFALAVALSESGRKYYRRLSCFYPSYSQSETDKQYSSCLASHGHGVTIKTLYHLAKSAGIDVSIKNQDNQKNHTNHSLDGIVKSPIPQNGEMEDMGKQEKQLPAFPKEIFETLPGLLHAITSNADSPEDDDLLLLGSLTVFSAYMPNVYGVYGKHEIFFKTCFFLLRQKLQQEKDDFLFAVVW